MKTMSSRERVAAVLRHELPDRVPNGWGGECTGLHALAYARLREALELAPRPARLFTFMMNAVMDIDTSLAMDGDILWLASGMCPARLWGQGHEEGWKPVQLFGTTVLAPKPWDIQLLPDGSARWGERVCPPGGLYFDNAAERSMAAVTEGTTRPSPRDYHPPMSLPEERLRQLEEEARWLFEHTSQAIGCGELITDLQYAPGGTVDWWMRMVEEPDDAHEFLDRAVTASLSQLMGLHQAIGKYVQLMQIGHDFGDNRCVTIGPPLWRSIYKPHFKRLFEGWRRITDIKIMLHSCGAIGEIIGDFVECGIDVLNPVQVSAFGMDPASLKARFGDRLVFYGGSLDSILCPPAAPPEVAYEQAAAHIRALKAGGGYIFSGVHNTPGDTPVSHLRALLQAYRDERTM